MALPTARIRTVAAAVVTRINTLTLTEFGSGTAAELAYSFGYANTELSAIKILVRPEDYGKEVEDNVSETIIYTIEVGILKMVSKRDVADIGKCINLAASINRLFPINYDLSLGGSDVAQVTAISPFPLMDKQVSVDSVDYGMDSIEETNVRFESRIRIEFREFGRAVAATT